MNCKKVQRWLPLMAGSDLSGSKAEAVKAHLAQCPHCQQEYEAYVRSLESAKEWLEKDRQDWEEREWQQVVRKAFEEKETAASPLAPWPFKRVWAYAMMGVMAVALTLIFVIRPFHLREGSAQDSEMFARTQAQLSGGTLEASQQDVVRMTMVLPESGQKIVWFFDRNFELEVKE